LCWPTANDVIAQSVLAGQAPPVARSYVNRQIRTIVAGEGGKDSFYCRYNILRPDIAIFSGPVPAGTGEVWEIKEFDPLNHTFSSADVVGGIAQLYGYVELLNSCCDSARTGNCGNGTFGQWANTVNAFKCGAVLGWVCVDGLIVYVWSVSQAKVLAALAAVAVLVGGPAVIPALPKFVPAG